MFRSVVIFLLACKVAAPATPETPPMLEDGAGALKTSGKDGLRFKRDERLQNDLKQVLSLSSTCTEQGSECASVHKVALGGVDPYNIGLYEPSPDTAVSSTIVTERIVLAACGKRVAADLGGEKLIFGNDDALQRLYLRALHRAPSESELAQLSTLTPTLQCFAVLTTSEALFY